MTETKEPTKEQPPTKQLAPEDQLVGLLRKMAPEIARALPRHLTVDRMSRIVTTAVRTVPDLGLCTPASFLGSVLSLAQIGLEPNTPLGQAFLVPRNMKGPGGTRVKTCTFIIGYQGLVDLMWRSERVVGVDAQAVRQGDKFSYRHGINQLLDHEKSDVANRHEQPVSHAWALVQVAGGGVVWEVLTRHDIEERRKRGNYHSSPWKDHYEAMCKKSALRALAPRAPRSAEVRLALSHDADSAALPGFSEEVKHLLQRSDLEIEAEGVLVPEAEQAPPTESADGAGGDLKERLKKRVAEEP